MSKKTIEERYQKLTQREHVLLRPGMYTGSIKKMNEELWIMDIENDKMIKKFVEFVPGFMKLFDEALTNATDHATRDKTVTTIKVEYNQEIGEISVWNNGSGIPVEMHKEQNIYVPELIFSHMLSGSNYNDNDQRTGSGLNGLGIKLCNIFSKSFTIETIDSENKKKYIQTFTDNMTNKTKPKITSNLGKSYTKVTFIPDYQRFEMNGLENDTVLLINKRVYDLMATTGSNVSVFLNGIKIKGKSFTDYTKYFFEGEKVIYESNIQNVRNTEFIWEYAVVPSAQYEQVSFVNGTCTLQGGKHVDHILYQIINKLKDQLEKKKKLKDIKPSFIKDRLFLFLKATIVNPSFNSQTKENLTTVAKDFGCKIEVSDKFIEKIYKSTIVNEIVDFCKIKESIDIGRKTDGKKVSKIYIPKLEDALWAGGKRSSECTLILTEGLSAMTFALWGRSVVGPEKYAVFPLKGKCISENTKIPLWNGEIKLAKDIKIGDILIGDNGNKRTVLTLFKGNGKMYEISQDRGESYNVNDEHILTMCIPEHKSIYWNKAGTKWKALYWDKLTNTIKVKVMNTYIKIKCNDCEMNMDINSLKIHYKRCHKNLKFEKSKTIINMNNIKIIEARKKLEEFLSDIDSNNIIDICIQDYLKIPKSYRRKLKGIRGQCVNWEENPIKLDPYILGLWLGDGGKDGYQYACNGEKDIEIINYLKEWGANNDAKFKKVDSATYSYSISSIENFRSAGCAPLKKLLEEYNLINNKHIPKEYLINSKENRLKLLAGIIDTDGYITQDGTIEISQSTKHKQLVEDIVYLSRSLGFYTHLKRKVTNYKYVKTGEKAEAYIIKISGDTVEIPTILPRKKSKSTSQYNIRNSTGIIKIKSIDNCNYVGIGIDDNSRFLINDFTVTHNCLNVRDASASQLINNEEINNIKQIIGLKQGEIYKDTSKLRYGKVMILTDSDVDGSHIKALFVNFIHTFWASLLEINPNFIQTLRTPIVKAIKGKQVIEFYTEQDYHKWKESGINTKVYQIRYFKGLGTSKKEDAKEAFKRFNELKVDYYFKDNNCNDSILLAFDKDKNTKKVNQTISDNCSGQSESNLSIKCTDRRKNWLSMYDKNVYIDTKENRVSYQDLINKELIHFSIYDNQRSIPSLLDGLKPSQRKILHYMLKKNINSEIKVAQLSGYISAETGYHHGEVSLQQAIIGLAQDFVGTNNINLLFPSGNFGSRLLIKDAASPRYIYTRLSDITNTIFNQNDLPLYNYLEDDGLSIEPEYFLPILPMVLVNGCEGIGTGYSTYVPPYNPVDLINNLFRIMDNENPLVLKPYFKGFNGIVDILESGNFITKGKWERLSDTQIKITELPIGVGVTNYKEYLEDLIECNKKNETKNKSKLVLKDVINKTLDENTGINFIVEFKNSDTLNDLITADLIEKELKLTKSFNTNNMHLFNKDLILTKYKTPNKILVEFYKLRIVYYQKRKEYIIKKLTRELELLNAKARFIKEYIDGILKINKQTKQYIINLLENKEYPKDEDSFDYLLKLPMYNLTLEKIKELEKQCITKQKELDYYISKTASELWKVDLTELLEKLN